FYLERIDRDRLDLDGKEPPVASTAFHFEEAGLLVMPHLAHDRALQRHSTGLAGSGQSFSAVHGIRTGIHGAKRAWPILTVLYRGGRPDAVSSSSPGARATPRTPGSA